MNKRHRKRLKRSAFRGRTFLAIRYRLEVPDCSCPRELPCACPEYCRPGDIIAGPIARCGCPVKLPPPCPHILAADHPVPIGLWQRFLAVNWPKEYGEPPLPQQPSNVLNPRAKVEIMRQRHTARQGLRSPEDLRVDDVNEHLAREVGRTANNRPVLLNLTITTGTSSRGEPPGKVA